VLTWLGTAIIRDPAKETDPEIAVGDGVDHQAEVVIPNRKDILIRKDVPIVNTATTVTIVRTAILTVNPTVRPTVRLVIALTIVDLIAEVTVEPAVNRKRASNAYYVTDRTA
jgi:hypothetical protein